MSTAVPAAETFVASATADTPPYRQTLQVTLGAPENAGDEFFIIEDITITGLSTDGARDGVLTVTDAASEKVLTTECVGPPGHYPPSTVWLPEGGISCRGAEVKLLVYDNGSGRSAGAGRVTLDVAYSCWRRVAPASLAG